jgi:hypothetical protein
LAEDSLIEILEVLEPKKAFLKKLRGEGARIIVQINSFSGRNYAFELSPDILGRYATLGVGVGLAHDVYPYAQNW